jgi:FixJ family two-component response regulator
MSSLALVHLVDDDESFLTALSRLLRLEGLSTQVFTSAEQLLESITPATRGCVVTDLNMPGMSGFDLQERLSASSAPIPIVFLTGDGDIPDSVQAMRRGAVDFMEKRAPRAQLVGSILMALERDAMEFEKRTRLREIHQRFARLTPRENEVLNHVLAGKMNKEIAAEMDLNQRTVKLHRTAITRKVGVHSPALLATLAQEIGFVTREHSQLHSKTA